MRFVRFARANRLAKLMQMQLNNAIGSEDASPVIRVPWAEEWMIKRALDAGAHGIMTPMCHSEVCLALTQLCNNPQEPSNHHYSA